jgi:lipopolysaccharide transport system permease protein
VIVSLVDFAIGALPLVGFMIYYGMGLSPHILWLPAILLVHVVFTAAMSLFLAMANLFYRDVKYIFEIALTVWMFATPVVYPIDQVTGTLGTILRLNPMTPIVEGYRAVLLMNSAPSIDLLPTAALSLALLGVAWVTFHRLEFKFAENI